MEPELEVTVWVQMDGHDLNLSEVAQDYRTNPNRFAVRYDGKAYDVEGRVQRIAEFNEVLDPIGGYYLPLKDRCANWLCEEMAREKPATFKGAVSALVMEFSRAKAAELNVGQKVQLHCNEIAVVSEDVVFRDCRMS